MTRIPIDTIDLNRAGAWPEHPDRNIAHLINDGSYQSDFLSPTVIAIDPGETTGWSLITVRQDAIIQRKAIHENILTFQHGQVDCGKGQGQLETDEFAGDEAASNVNPGRNPRGEAMGVARLIELIDENPGAAIIIENFILDFRKANKSASSLSPVRVTARLEQELWHRNRAAFRQLPSLAKTTMSDDRLKEFELYQRTGGLVHARDADRHALTFLRRCQLDPELRWRAWPMSFDQPEIKPKRKRAKIQTGQRISFPVD